MLNSRCSLPSATFLARKMAASTVPSAYTSRPHTLCLNSRVTAGQGGGGGREGGTVVRSGAMRVGEHGWWW